MVVFANFWHVYQKRERTRFVILGYEITWQCTKLIKFTWIGGIMDFHFATAFETVADSFPNRIATIADGRELSWGDFERRAASIAGLLHAHGIGADAKAGLYLHNTSEYQEAQFGVFKVGGCPINVNYRYKADELVYLLDNADAEVVFYQACYAMRIWEIRERLPKVKLLVQIDDGTEALLKGAVDYERAIRDHAPLARQTQNPEATYMLYTGGTTGMPKGVMYPVGNFTHYFIASGAAGRELQPPESMGEFADYLQLIEQPPISLPACPLMHGTGMWLGSFLPMLLGRHSGDHLETRHGSGSAARHGGRPSCYRLNHCG